MLNAAQRFGFGLPAMEDRDVVTISNQTSKYVRSYETCAADNEDFHSSISFGTIQQCGLMFELTRRRESKHPPPEPIHPSSFRFHHSSLQFALPPLASND